MRLVPEQNVYGFPDRALTAADFEVLCFSVYNCILQPIEREMSRRFFEHGERMRYFQKPAYTLARPLHAGVKYHFQTPLRSLDVVDGHTLLHIGYQVTCCGKWVLTAAIDQRGEAHDLGVFSSCGDRSVVEAVWDFAVEFGKRANAEWRVIIAKRGVIGELELEGSLIMLIDSVLR